MKQILAAYRNGLPYNIKMQSNGLIWAGEKGFALTWMDAVVCGKPVTPRIGYPVEINALWYNAIMFTLELAAQNKDTKFIKEWEPIANMARENFTKVFWNDSLGYLADYVDDNGQNMFVRPNQIFAASLPYSMLTDEMKRSIIATVERELLTAKGLRTLAPKNPAYQGIYEGDQAKRDSAYHQGTVWPWLSGHFIEAYLSVDPQAALIVAKKLVEGLKEEVNRYGICSISEIFDGDPPQRPRGAISQAWSVAETLRIIRLIEKQEKSQKR